MMGTPSKRYLKRCQVVLLGDVFDQPKGVKSSIFEVTIPVHFPLPVVDVTVAPFLGNVSALDLARKEATCKWVVNDNVDAISVARRDELLFQ